MFVIYIAGPYRAPNAWAIEQQIRNAEWLALQVWAEGMVPICPHTMTRYYQGVLPDATWLAGDLELLSRCDAVLLTDDWPMSAGATAEREHALTRGLPVFESLDELMAWRERKALDAGDVAPASSVEHD